MVNLSGYGTRRAIPVGVEEQETTSMIALTSHLGSADDARRLAAVLNHYADTLEHGPSDLPPLSPELEAWARAAEIAYREGTPGR
jgi:hypothetical protein